MRAIQKFFAIHGVTIGICVCTVGILFGLYDVLFEPVTARSHVVLTFQKGQADDDGVLYDYIGSEDFGEDLIRAIQDSGQAYNVVMENHWWRKILDLDPETLGAKVEKGRKQEAALLLIEKLKVKDNGSGEFQVEATTDSPDFSLFLADMAALVLASESHGQLIIKKVADPLSTTYRWYYPESIINGALFGFALGLLLSLALEGFGALSSLLNGARQDSGRLVRIR